MIKIVHGHPFALVGMSVHNRLNGTETFRMTWRSRCAICDELFETETLGVGKGFSPKPICNQHDRQPDRARKPILSLKGGAA